MSHKLPSGKWHAQVRLPDGRRMTRTDPLKRVVDAWAAEQQAAIRRGRWRDPRDAKIPLAQWHARWWAVRVASRKTMEANEGIWRRRVEPRWGHCPLDSIARIDVSGWAREMIAEGVGLRTVQQSVSLLSMLLQAAVDEDPPILASNPCRLVRRSLPPAVTRPPAYFTRTEHAKLLAVLTEPWRTLVDFDMHAGLRLGEIAGLRRESLDLARGIVHVLWVREADGTEREWPKSKKSRRSIRIPPHCIGPLRELTRDCLPAAPVFRTKGGAHLITGNFRTRIWYPALAKAGLPRRTPHTMRHTAASWLVMEGEDLYRVQTLLGHEDYSTTLRYAHLAPDAGASAVAAWTRMAERDRAGVVAEAVADE